MEVNVSNERLAIGLRGAWSAGTSASPESWTRDVPERGQCAVTALVVQDYLGGEIVRAVTQGVSHYWNILPDGSELDLTRGQFDHFTPGTVERRSRDYVLSFVGTHVRYTRLRDAVSDILTNLLSVDLR